MDTHTIPAPIQANPQWLNLYQRLQAFKVATYGDDVPLSFMRRLAREHNWTMTYAERVFAEYQRFLFMTATAGHFVCPGEDVDQVWHLHLTYSQSYWDDLCTGILGKPLHHIPSRGGAEETAAFYRDYSKSLESYERLFGERPPADIWVAPHERLRDTPHLQLTNTRQHWVIHKPGWFESSINILTSPWTILLSAPCLFYWAGLEWVIWLIPLIFAWGAFSSEWNNQRCPQCKTRHAFQPTGLIASDGKTEHRCHTCGLVQWHSPSSGDGSGSGGSGGGCGGSGGSGGG